jgi:hypothetical protein
MPDDLSRCNAQRNRQKGKTGNGQEDAANDRRELLKELGFT